MNDPATPLGSRTTAPAAGSATARRATVESAIALGVAVAAIALFLPPMLEATLSSVMRIVLTAVAITLGMVLHWVWLLVALRARRRPPLLPLVAAVLLFPVGGAVVLALLAWVWNDDEAGG